MLRFFMKLKDASAVHSLTSSRFKEQMLKAYFKQLIAIFQTMHLLAIHLAGLGSDGANVMLESRNSVLSRLKAKQLGLISFHCNCHLAALIANHALKALPDFLEDATIQIWYFFQRGIEFLKNFKCLLNLSPISY